MAEVYVRAIACRGSGQKACPFASLHLGLRAVREGMSQEHVADAGPYRNL